MDLYAWLFECDNLLTRTWFRMRHPILAAAVATRLRLRESGREKGFYHAVTMNGMTLGPAFGRACADLVLGRAANPLVD